MKLLYFITSFLSAFLLFQVQPIISKYFLPIFGGTAAVWTTTVMTFQILLVLGYLYSAFLVTKNFKFQIVFQIFLIILVVFLQIFYSKDWPGYIIPPFDQISNLTVDSPQVGLVWGILMSVGLIYLLLSSTTTVIQSWHARVFKSESPYYLYRASNLGSFFGLLTYPFLIEPFLKINDQASLFFYSFILYGVTLFILSVPLLRAKMFTQNPPKNLFSKKPEIRKYFVWMGMSAIPTLIMLAVTENFSQGIASFPFHWIVPLSLYLLSFVIGFKDLGDKEKTILKIAYMSSLFAFVYAILEIFGFSYYLLQMSVYNIFLLFVSIAFHNYLYKNKPSNNYLSYFYLSLSVGGMIGGLFVGVIAPLIFSEYVELKLGILISVCVLSEIIQSKYFTGKIKNEVKRQLRTFQLYQIGFILLAFVGLSLYTSKGSVYKSRNFYGTLKVTSIADYKSLYNGKILHGTQLNREENKFFPMTYYSKGSGVGLMISKRKSENTKTNIGVIGLGVGTLASYCDQNTKVVFYEINPDVIEIATNKFSYLTKCDSSLVVSGDGRIQLEKETIQNSELYDILVVDAFTDDSIPVHLLTNEAFKIYLSRINDNGVLALHVSNKYLDLAEPIKRLVTENGLSMKIIQERNPSTVYSSYNDWILVARNKEEIELELPENTSYRNTDDIGEGTLWTDDYSSILPTLKLF